MEHRPVQMMAILNVTPDSFSDGGRFTALDQIVAEAGKALEAGASILDIGGESTRPGAKAVDVEEEKQRVLPAIEAVHAAFPDALISVDTRKSEVAHLALRAGAQMINDVSGLVYDPQMMHVVARHGAWVVIMHSQGEPETMQDSPDYPRGVLNEVKTFLAIQAHAAMTAGVAQDRIILDPGFGFGKTLPQNLELLQHMDALMAIGFPLLVGLSRKGFLAMGDEAITPDKREALTAASMGIAVSKGASFVRVHDLQAQGPVVKLLNALQQANEDVPEKAQFAGAFWGIKSPPDE